jgi:hypothetical protein
MLNKLPLAPFALAFFPILSMLSSNAAEVSFTVAIRPLIISLVFATLLLSILRLILRGWEKAAVLTSFTLLLFFSYGHVYSLLESHPIFGVNFGRHRYLVILYGLSFLAGIVVLAVKLKPRAQILLALNLISLALLATPLVQLVRFSLQTSQQQRQAAQSTSLLDEPLKPSFQPLPDVYYIVLDSHTRSDALLTDYNLDNSPYLDQLRQMGFYIADCSRTNYDYTQAAIVAALDMDYLTSLYPYLEQLNTKDTWVLLKKSRVRNLLEQAGYKTVAFNTGYEWSNLRDADIYLSLGNDSYSLQKVNPFEAMLIKSTALLILTDSQVQFLLSRFKDVNFPYSYHVISQNFILEQLPLIAKDPDPTFAFVHLLVPHVPFVFAPDGSIVSDPLFYNGDKAWPGDDVHRTLGYANQVEFIDRKMVEIMRAILAESVTPPIIVIMGDHGLLGENRYEILNAYYLPAGGSRELYPSITPVNSFRVIFDVFFGSHYDLLPDVSLSQDAQPVPETSPACAGQ